MYFWFSKACTLCTFGFLKPVPPVLMIVFLGGIKYCRGSLGGQVFFFIYKTCYAVTVLFTFVLHPQIHM
jgi:hypothetical protein